MTLRTVSLVCVGIAAILVSTVLFAQAGVAAQPDFGASPSSPARRDASLSPGSIAFAPVFTGYLPIIDKFELFKPLDWLRQQQDPTTGLLPCQQDNMAKTYCNALAAIAFTLEGDQDRAQRILAYYDAQAGEFFHDRCDSFDAACAITDPCGPAEPCGFWDFRDSVTGIPFQNDADDRWMGDNAWLLTAIHYYQSQTGDTGYETMGQAIVRMLKAFQQSDGHIAAGWQDGDTHFNPDGYAEGNLSAYKPLLQWGETETAEQIKHWLDHHQFGLGTWQETALELCSWRVLSLGREYGFCLPERERTDDDTLRFKNTFDYHGSSVTGFLPFSVAHLAEQGCSMPDNAWSEGTGQMAVAFMKAGYTDYHRFYERELEKLLFEPPAFPGTLALSFLPNASDCPTYTVFDPTKGHVSAVTWYLFAKARLDPFDGVILTPAAIADPFAQVEAENHVATSAVGIRGEGSGTAFEGEAIHGGDDDYEVGDDSGWAEYRFNVLVPLDGALRVRYADDLAGDGVRVLLDGTLVTGFTTVDTGTWLDYVITNPSSTVALSPGLHTLRLEVDDGGSLGVNVDWFRLDTDTARR